MTKIITTALLFLSSYALADNPYISVGTAKSRKTVVAFPDVRALGTAPNLKTHAKTVTDAVNHDLTFMDLFKFLSPSAFTEDTAKAGIAIGSFNFSDWQAIGTEFLVKAGVSQTTGDSVTLEGYLFDVAQNRQILGKKYVARSTDLKVLAHTFANDVVNTLTGLPGIFLTKIAMTCERNRRKEIYIMDYDGSNVRQVTSHKSTAIAPAWSPDGTKIAYTLFSRHRNNVKNPDIFEFDFRTNSLKLLSNRKGMNSGAAYAPDGRSLALTMSFLGDPEIFSLDLSTGNVTRLTKSFGVDVDPSYSPDGKQLVFVSGRSGPPMVFKMGADGSSPQRLTYAGTYNATPNWSPMNNKIVFASWIDKTFDVFTMNIDGTNIERLTKSQGNNEDPTFSPDGNFVVFSSNRSGSKRIYVMNLDGSFVKPLTFGLGNCTAPRWSPPPK